MGERGPTTDLMAWNADSTRMPYRMHSQYLRQIFLDNDLAEDRFMVEGKPVALTDIRVPIFAVGTVSDHVAPWHSTYKINFQTDTEVTYLLTTGGHNAGIVSEPGHAGRSFQVMARKADDHYRDPHLPGAGAAQGWLMVAGMGGVARRPFRRSGGAATDRRCGVGLCAPRRCPRELRFRGLIAQRRQCLSACRRRAPTDFGSYPPHKIARLDASPTQCMTILLRFQDFRV
jgi:hypothetical protein